MSASTQLPPFLAVANTLSSQTAYDHGDGLATPDVNDATHVGSTRQASIEVPASVVDQHKVVSATPAPAVQAIPEPFADENAELAFSAFADPLSQQTSPMLLVPPLNFDMICASKGNARGTIYRSGFPNERNYAFLNTLNLASVVYLANDDVRPNLQRWINTTRGQTRLLHFRIAVNKEPFGEMEQETVEHALKAMLDRRNLPMLIHCNKGKYRVGVMTALLRRVQDWNLTSIYDEYARFAGLDRIADEEFIETFPLTAIRKSLSHPPDWLPHR